LKFEFKRRGKEGVKGMFISFKFSSSSVAFSSALVEVILEKGILGTSGGWFNKR